MLKKFISLVPVAALTLTVSANAQASTITVEKGDTLWDLARANNTTVENIQTVNDLTTDLIHPGDVLAIAKEKRYAVKQGDTLWDIAVNHRVTVNQIKEWNHLHSDFIQPGLDLLIFEGLKANNKVVTKKAEVTTVKEQEENSSKVTTPLTDNNASKENKIEVSTPTTNRNDSKKVPSEASAQATNIEVSPSKETASSTNNTDLKKITMEATAYTASCDGCSGITSTGINLKENPDAKVISVDPTVIPLGSKVYVESYGEAIAGDTGSGIKGNKIDVFIPSQQEAVNFGVKQLTVTILE